MGYKQIRDKLESLFIHPSASQKTKLNQIVKIVRLGEYGGMGLALGYIIQQNREAFNQIPNGQIATATLANLMMLTEKDITFTLATNKHNGHSENLMSDLEYVTILNVCGAIGYSVGFIKDIVEKCYS